MGLTNGNLLYVSSTQDVSLWNLNHFLHFWSLSGNQVTHLKLEGYRGKSWRVVALGDDSRSVLCLSTTPCRIMYSEEEMVDITSARWIEKDMML